MADETVYDIRFDLDALISSEVETYINSFDVEEDEVLNKKISSLNNQLRGVERKSKEISKIFNDCQDELARFRLELETEERDQEERMKNAVEAAENVQKPSSDSDDDIQFVKTTYEPHHKRQRGTSPKGATQTQSSSTQKTEPPETDEIMDTSGKQAVAQCSNRTMDSVRKALTDAINKHLPTNPPQAAKKDLAVLKPVSSLTKVKKDTAKPAGHAAKSHNYPPPQQGKISYNNPLQPIVIDDTKPDEFEEVIKVNGRVLAKKFNDIWYNATVTDIQNADKSIEERRYKVKYEFKGMKVLTARSIAHKDPLKFPVAVGSRVVALYRDEEVTLSTSYYAGILAESPSSKNNFRYLVFFDDGYAQYSQPGDIHRVFLQSENVWEDIHPDSQEFIKEYLAQYPERPMVRLQKSQTIKVEWNGKWWTAKVAEVDSSLVKMFFPSDKRTEWIYRGSTRLEPLYTALANAEANKAAGKGKRHNLLVQKDRKPVVEYTRGENQANKNTDSKLLVIKQVPASTTTQTEPKKDMDSDVKKRPVARKSTGGACIQNKPPPPGDDSQKVSVSSTGPPIVTWEAPWLKLQKKQQDVNATIMEKRKERFQASSFSSNKLGKDMASVLQERLAVEPSSPADDESFGERVPNKVSVKNLTRKPYFPHRCGKRCLKDIADSPGKFKGNNPLLIPLLCGWERQVCKVKPSSRRTVLYRAPCVRRLRCMAEVDRYLKITDCKLTIDAFSFDPQLHVHTEFVPVKTFCDIKDLSYGKENVAISCVNGIDRQYPDYVEYSNKRIPAKGVPLNLDPNFLSGCSCKDNCRDKSKCECRQLTIKATSYLSGGKADKNAGYTYRRLEEPLLTGVYECNSKCNCNSRCNNRVAQNGLQRRLQVYKTEKRGWGLRCLDDIPAGGFICIYAGQLLTEQGANEDGQQYGDEYLAELDYIEVVERQKEGYESDVDVDEGIDSDEEEEQTDSDQPGQSCHSSDSEFGVTKTGSGIPVKDQTVEQRTHATRRQKKLERQGSTDTKNSADAKEISKIVLKRKSTEKNWSVKMHNASAAKNTAAWVESLQHDVATSDQETESKQKPEEFPSDADDELPDLDPQSPPVTKQEESVVEREEEKDKKPFAGLPRPRKSTTTPKMSRFKNLPDPKSRKKHDEGEEIVDTSQLLRLGTRSLFGDGQMCYIMDAKSMGNLGRYLNHSCSPNVFVQNVFVDTHDLRFPWVAFFAGEFIRAGTELTWDYNYEVGSVPGKVLYCYCGSADCRGRLL